MREFLLFDLYGPMASWGDVAVGEVRPSRRIPSRSALLGLISATLGLRRTDDESLAALSRGLSFAVLVLADGTQLRDYHTLQVDPPRRGRLFLTRADQLRDGEQTLVSERSYRTDVLYRVAAWTREPGRWALEDLANALAKPVFAPYLGRKACPLALPVDPRVVKGESLRDVFAADPAELFEPLEAPRQEGASVVWEGDKKIAGVEPERVVLRRDEPVSRRRWTFAVHEHFFATLPKEE